MTIGIIAANGRTGREVVNIAIERGHRVRAGVYGAYDLDIHQNVEIITCDATSKDNLRELLIGCEVVVCVIGHQGGAEPTVQTKAIVAATDVMNELGIVRLVSLTGTGARLEGDNVSLIDRLLNRFVKFIDPSRITDGINHVDVLKQSKLDWTIVRVLKLTSGPKQNFSLSDHGPALIFVSRKTVATAILDVIEQNSFIARMPIISRKV